MVKLESYQNHKCSHIEKMQEAKIFTATPHIGFQTTEYIASHRTRITR